MSTASVSGSGDDARARKQQPMLARHRSKEQQMSHPTEEQRMGRAGGWFPLGYKDGFSQWWANISPAAAEHKVISFVPYLQQPPTQMETGSAPVSTSPSSLSIGEDKPDTVHTVTTNSITDPYGPRRWHSNLVKLPGKERALNEFSIERVGETVEENLVMVHGYGAGLGFFYRNFEGLSRPKGWKLWALDMLGMGRSSRPPFRIHAKDREGKIAEAESWFVDSLEEWRIARKIDKFTLLGHSLGGYMAVAYALKYPGHLKKLILASPVGIPEDPYAVNEAMPEPESSTMGNEFTQSQEETAGHTSLDGSRSSGDNNRLFNARAKAEQDAAKKATADDGGSGPRRKPLPKWLTYLWDANISPFSIIRWGGPLGPRFVSGWTTRRFSFLPAEESQALHHYSYTLFRQRGSGEYALSYILAPGAFARSPLIRRIQDVGRQVISPPSTDSTASNVSPPSGTLKEHGIPIVFMYGENDWMDIAGGYAAEQKLKEEQEKVLKSASPEERKLENGSAKVLVIKKAGHHVYLDGWEEFNQVMREEMADVSRHSKSLMS